jgi:hypothetical protein
MTLLRTFLKILTANLMCAFNVPCKFNCIVENLFTGVIKYVGPLDVSSLFALDHNIYFSLFCHDWMKFLIQFWFAGGLLAELSCADSC